MFGAFSHVFLEGSLKADLIKSGIFNKKRCKYLQKTADGKKEFCQIAEFFTLAFKFGYEATVNGVSLSYHKYFQSLNGNAFQPLSKNVTLYPSLYKEMYSPDSAFAQAVSPVFKVHAHFDPKSEITAWEVTV